MAEDMVDTEDTDLMEVMVMAVVTMARETLMLKLSQDTDMVVMVMADLMEDTDHMVDMDTAEDTTAREVLMLRLLLLLSQDTMVVMDMAEVTTERERLMLSQDMDMADIMVVMDMA